MSTAMVRIESEELRQLCTLLIVADPLPDNVDHDILSDVLDRAAHELGFAGGWVEAYHMNTPEPRGRTVSEGAADLAASNVGDRRQWRGR